MGIRDLLAWWKSRLAEWPGGRWGRASRVERRQLRRGCGARRRGAEGRTASRHRRHHARLHRWLRPGRKRRLGRLRRGSRRQRLRHHVSGLRRCRFTWRRPLGRYDADRRSRFRRREVVLLAVPRPGHAGQGDRRAGRCRYAVGRTIPDRSVFLHLLLESVIAKIGKRLRGIVEHRAARAARSRS
jgi:hypothetical protein